MIPVPTKWDELKTRTGESWAGGWIVKVTYIDLAGFQVIIYVSDTEMQLGADHIYGWLKSISEFGRGLDLYKMSYNAARAVVTLRDPLYQRIADIPARPSDKIPMIGATALDQLGLHQGSIELMLYPGAYATSIADCLSVYQGNITRYTTQNEALILFTDERRKVIHRELPQRQFTRTLFPKMPIDELNETMPLVYGPHNELPQLRNTGFAPAYRIDTWKWLVADHPIFAFYEEVRIGASPTKAVWIWIDELKSWARSYTGVTFNENDGGRATFEIDPDNAGFDVYIYASHARPTASALDPANPRGAEAIYDYDFDSKITVYANSATMAEIILEWHQQGDESDDDKNNSVAAFPGPVESIYGFQIYASKAAGITITSGSISYWDGLAWITLSSLVDVNTQNLVNYAFPLNVVYGSSSSVRWHLSSGMSSPGGDRKPFKLRIRFEGSGWINSGTIVAYIHEARLCWSCQMPRDSATQVGWKTVSERVKVREVDGRFYGEYRWINHALPVMDIDTRVIGASVQGRTYGSWIDNGGRTNSLNAGQQISVAPGIIESLLRDELGIATGSIDQASFDAAYNDTTYTRAAKWHLKAGARENSKAVIERLCWEHGIALVHRPNGQLKLLRLPGSGELAGTLYPDDILEQTPIIETTDAASIRNTLTFRYKQMADSGKYLGRLVRGTVDGKSENRYGQIPDEFDMRSIPNMIGITPAIFDYLLDGYALLAKPHISVQFTTRGFRFASAELGDHFRFQDANYEMRSIRQRLGKSWANIDLMIYDMQYRTNGIHFTCFKWAPE